MKYKTFKSNEGWFSLELPLSWELYENEKGTYAFYDTIKWAGNLRITPLKWESSRNINFAAEHIQDEIKNSQNYTKSKIGSFDCVSYKKYTTQDNEDLLMYYWTFGHNKILFICTFTVDKKNEFTKENKLELERVNAIFQSIKLNY